MNNLFLTLAAIALVDSINPNAMAVQIYLLTTPKPTARSIAFIFGDFLAAWIAGFVITLGMAQIITHVLDRLSAFSLVLQLVLGIALITAGYYIGKISRTPSAKRPKSIKPIHTFFFGLTMAFVETPTALPYLAAIERINRANLSMFGLIAALTFYCLIFVLPLIGLLVISTVLQERGARLLKRIQQIVNQWFPRSFQAILIGFGIVLIIDSVMHLFGRSIL